MTHPTLTFHRYVFASRSGPAARLEPPRGAAAARRRRAAIALACLHALPLTAGAAALTDGTTGAVQSLAGRFTVPQSLGTVRGANLFHSFTRFGVAPGESATFTTSDAGIRHVVSRVTGGEASVIQGPVALQAAAGSRPSFWFVNPNGIVVGAGAAFDVPAGLHLATAPQLRFADGFVWDTRGGTSTLSVAAPESFGFAGPAARLSWQGTTTSVTADATIELAGGDIDVAASKLYGGRTRVQATGELRLTQGAQLWALAQDGGGDGSLRVDAGALTIEGRTSQGASAIYALTAPDAAGGGDITLRVAGALALRGGAEIESGNFSPHAGGRVEVDAGALRLDGQGALTQLGTQTYGPGAAGAVTVRSRGPVGLERGAQIRSVGSAAGAPGAITLIAPSLFADGGGVVRFYTGLYSEAAGSGAAAVSAQIDGHAELRDAVLWSVSSAPTPSGPVTLSAGTVHLTGRNTIVGSLVDGSGRSGDVEVRARERLTMAEGATIATATLGDGDAGAVVVRAPLIRIAGHPETTSGITSGGSDGVGGAAGPITVEAGRIELTANGQINASTLSDGNAGHVTVRADSMLVDGGGAFVTGLSAMALGRRGDAGTLRLAIRDDLEIRDGGAIFVANLGAGSPGLIDVSAGTVTIDGRRAPTIYTGIGGDAIVYQGRGGLAAGGTVVVQARRVAVRNGGTISSSTNSAQPAGSVRVVAETIELDGGDRSQATGIATDTFGAGAAGNLTLQADTITVTNDASITSNSFAPGRGGTVTIDARRLHLRDAGAVLTVTGVAEGASSRVTGDAGDIVIRVADAMTVESGGAVLANTGATGAAGRIRIEAGSLTVGGRDAVTALPSQIASRAQASSDGQPGSVTLAVAGPLALRDGAVLSVENRARVADPAAVRPSTIGVDAGSIEIAGGATVLAASRANANAGRITLTSRGAFTVDGATVSTSAVDGDGGPIAVRAAETLRLRDASITTSVLGSSNGNGGDITITSPALVLQSGFVQANTAAPRARGGNVTIDVGVLVPDGSNVALGGGRIESFRAGVAGGNVVQAAAPEGLAGTLDITLPQLDLSGSLVALALPRVDLTALLQDLCQIGGASSLTVLGRGALRPAAGGAVTVEP